MVILNIGNRDDLNMVTPLWPSPERQIQAWATDFSSLSSPRLATSIGGSQGSPLVHGAHQNEGCIIPRYTYQIPAWVMRQWRVLGLG